MTALLGKNFTDVTCVTREARTSNPAVELVALSTATALVARTCQPSRLPVLVDWFGDARGGRISSDSLMERTSEDNL